MATPAAAAAPEAQVTEQLPIPEPARARAAPPLRRAAQLRHVDEVLAELGHHLAQHKAGTCKGVEPGCDVAVIRTRIDMWLDRRARTTRGDDA